MKTTTLLSIAALCLANASLAPASEWRKVEDSDELRALYSNKTFRFNYSEVNKPAVLHYRADGTGMLVLLVGSIRVRGRSGAGTRCASATRFADSSATTCCATRRIPPRFWSTPRTGGWAAS